MITPHVPPSLKEELDAAERRKDGAIERLIAKTATLPAAAFDDFEKAMADIVDADARAVRLIRERRQNREP